jgi:hypothetical protein
MKRAQMGCKGGWYIKWAQMGCKGGWYIKRAQNFVQCRAAILIFHVLLLDKKKKIPNIIWFTQLRYF